MQVSLQNSAYVTYTIQVTYAGKTIPDPVKVDTSSKESNIIRELNFIFLYFMLLYYQKLIHGEISVNEFIVNLKHINK